MTTTSAGSGASAGDGGDPRGARNGTAPGNGGDWGWFTPSRPEADEPPTDDTAPEAGTGAGAGAGTRAGTAPGAAARSAAGTGAGPGAAGQRPAGRTARPTTPSAPGLPTGPTAPSAGRAPLNPRTAATTPAPAPPRSAAPGAPADTDAVGASGGERLREHPAPRGPEPTGPTGTAFGGTPPRPQPQSPIPDPAFADLPPLSTVEPSPYAQLIRRTMEEVEQHADAATAYFYALLFVRYPELRDFFPASMDAQRDRLFRALLTAVRLIDDPDVLERYLSGLGRGHRKYGTLPEHYPAVGECLLGALAQYAPLSWSDETEEAWVQAYTQISQLMIDAAAEDEDRAPAWWNAEIVAIERRTPQIAVITVRPDQPYPFLAGQYASVETPWWPRVWRHYSFASPPRSDGLLVFHVKAVAAGWVSTALVHHARPGDVLRLGPPSGSMTVDHASSNGLLCLGGGTGIAPIKALVEDVAQHGSARPVEVFYGAENDHDLYDLDTMLRLEREHGWLSVRPVVAHGPGPSHVQALAGQLPDAVRQYGPWSSYVGYLSGPPGMIRSGVRALTVAGIPSHRIRHDALDELVLSGGRH